MHPDPKTYGFPTKNTKKFSHRFSPCFRHSTQQWQVRGVRHEFHVQGRGALKGRGLGDAQELRQERSVQGPWRLGAVSMVFGQFCMGKKPGKMWFCMVLYGFVWSYGVLYYDIFWSDILWYWSIGPRWAPAVMLKWIQAKNGDSNLKQLKTIYININMENIRVI